MRAPAANTPDTSKVCGILVTYNPGNDISEVLLSAVEDLDALIVIDNCSDPKNVRNIELSANEVRRNVTDKGDSLLLRQNNENLGIAKAFNQGVRLAIEKGFDFVLFMDQDTIIRSGTIAKLKSNFYALSERYGKVALSCSNIEFVSLSIDNFLSGYYKRHNFARLDGAQEVILGINSGLFMKLSTFDEVGYFDERYFLDSVDHEFYLRLRKHSVRVFAIEDARVEHRLGSVESFEFGLVRLQFRTQKKERYYYIFRDTPKTVTRYFREYSTICILLALSLLMTSGIMLLSFNNRTSNLSFVARGLLGYIKGEEGKLAV